MDDPEVVFPLDKMDRQVLCRIGAVVNDYTTHRIIPPFQTPIPKSTYDFVLDHAVLAATLTRTLGLTGYRIARVGPNAFQGDDGQGSEGLVELLYRDTTRRVYHMQGRHYGKIFPVITGEAIVLLNYHVEVAGNGRESVATRIATYSKLDNPILAALVRVLQPILRRVVNEKLAEGFLAVHRLGELMAADPESVYRQAEAIAEVDKAELGALRALLLPPLTPPRP